MAQFTQLSVVCGRRFLIDWDIDDDESVFIGICLLFNL